MYLVEGGLLKIDKRGRVTIPVEYRRLLNLKENDDVTMILHERSLQLVKTINKERYTRIFKKLKKKLKGKGHNEDEIKLIISSLLKQQFYLKDNEILDRTGRFTITLEGSDEIIREVQNLIEKQLPLWYKGEYYTFIMQLGIVFELDWEYFLQEIGERIELLLRYSEEGKSSLDEYVVFSMIISKLIYCFREKAALNLIRELKNEYSFIYRNELPMKKIQRLLSQEASLLLNMRIFDEFHSLLRRSRNVLYQKLKTSVIKLLESEIDGIVDLRDEVEEIRAIRRDEDEEIVKLEEGIEFKIPKPP